MDRPGKLDMTRFLVVAVAMTLALPLYAAEADLQKQIDALSQRVKQLEQTISGLSNENNWKDPAYWSRLKRDMPESDVRNILGNPARIEKSIFATWYYHASSKLHSFVWFDEGKVLGWEAPQN